MPLEHYRKEINQIDQELTNLFLKRMDIVKKVAQYKLQHNMEVMQPQREKILLKKLTENRSSPESGYILELYHTILSISRASQQNLLEEQEKTAE